MECVNCGENVNKFFVEKLVCTHCGEELILDYYYCPRCNTAWKSQDGTPIFITDLNNELLDDDLEAIFDTIEKEFESDGEKKSMSEFLHKCIRCNALCYEVADGRYKCPVCEFEWEVIKNV
jgi:hypothetical protein